MNTCLLFSILYLLSPNLCLTPFEPTLTLESDDNTGNFEVDEPEFTDIIPNVTVPIGREAKIPCKVRSLGTYKVAWLRVESKTILTIHQHIITRNYRIGLTHSDDRQWNLHINDAQESDRGGYMCQVNTVPMKFQVGYLDVVVPPDIITSETSSDVMARENSNVTLACRAKGYPPPRITWRREDGKAIEYGNWQELKNQGVKAPEIYEGETLTINKVSRLHMGAYLCIAANGVPPSVSKRIILNVHFPPMIWVPNQLIGAPLGGEALLVCNTEAFPISINYWTKDDDDALVHALKYEITNTKKTYKVHMTLRIRNIEIGDFGTYKCFARNSLGSTEGSIKLYEVHSPKGKSGARRHPANAQSQSFNDESSSLSEVNKAKAMENNEMSQSYTNSGTCRSKNV